MSKKNKSIEIIKRDGFFIALIKSDGKQEENIKKYSESDKYEILDQAYANTSAQGSDEVILIVREIK